LIRIFDFVTIGLQIGREKESNHMVSNGRGKMFNRALILVVTLSAVLAGSMAQASLMVNETFTYPNGNLVGNDGWTAHSGAGSSPIQVSSGRALVVQGSGSREDDNTPLGSSLVAGQTFYAAFNVIITASGSLSGPTATYFSHFYQNSSTFRSRVFAIADGASGRDFSIGLGDVAGDGSPPAQWATGFNFGTNLRIVHSYSFTDANTGTSRLWINPTLQSDTSISDTVTTNGGGSILGYALRQGTPTAPFPTESVDNLCVADNFADALNCTPEPTAALLLGLGALALVRRRR
jgi:MYXO-CTERM domain-containing protein